MRRLNLSLSPLLRVNRCGCEIKIQALGLVILYSFYEPTTSVLVVLFEILFAHLSVFVGLDPPGVG